jgi:hypothetical protein
VLQLRNLGVEFDQIPLEPVIDALASKLLVVTSYKPINPIIRTRATSRGCVFCASVNETIE